MLAEEHPVQEEKVLPSLVAGAVSPNMAPAAPVSLKLVVPWTARAVGEKVTVITTPLAGLVEFTVST